MGDRSRCPTQNKRPVLLKRAGIYLFPIFVPYERPSRLLPAVAVASIHPVSDKRASRKPSLHTLAYTPLFSASSFAVWGMVFTGPGAREGGWGGTRAPSLILPTASVRAVSLCLKGGVPLSTKLPTTGLLGNLALSCVAKPYTIRIMLHRTGTGWASANTHSRKPTVAISRSIHPYRGV